MARLVRIGVALVMVLVGCNNSERLKEPDPGALKKEANEQAPSKQAPPTLTSAPTPTPPPPSEPKEAASDDPLKGKFTLADATKDLPGKGPLVASIKTSEGDLKCKLFDDKAPITVANFIGLATGKRTWKDPSGAWVNKPAYDGTTFHRIIKGFMIQGGDARGNGTGEPGYVIPDEAWGGKHDKPGLLCMANRGKDTNGAQFFITDEAAAHLDTGYTIFGECSPVDTVHKIASVPVRGSRPEKPVKIDSVKISRDKG
jgi:peptidyl-prolyl cis-trans isomerase A (cyclophilin A)